MDTMTEKQSAIVSAMKLNAHGLSDVQNVEEAKVYAGIIFSLNCELEKETPSKRQVGELNELKF
ncbi:hypothetical protein [Ethanoligenens sp.]|uniref:hypothetical protein n=1 Tax=Ethanoligenens sp. TaxID=2099655 RepID=UPI0039EA2687